MRRDFNVIPRFLINSAPLVPKRLLENTLFSANSLSEIIFFSFNLAFS